MKRVMLSMAVLASLSAACSPSPPRRAGAGAEAEATWTRPPAIVRVERAGGAILVSGLAEPGGRVVLRRDQGEAFAASADGRGRFEIRVPAQTGHLLLRPETQVGEDAAASPDHLLILPGGHGPIAVLRAGGSTRRLDAAPPLAAIDSDGGMRLASGRTPPGTARVEVQSGGQTVQVAPDVSGYWSIMLPPHQGPDEIRVGGRVFVWPGESGLTQGLAVEQAGTGWRVRWSGPGNARQSTWLPMVRAP